MRLTMEHAEVFIPDGLEEVQAIKRTTHMTIAAHQDDIEIMAYDGIVQCFGNHNQWFTGVVVTNGSGSPRNGKFAQYSDEEMKDIRKEEQKSAALIGEYSAQVLLNYPSSAVKNPKAMEVKEEFKTLISLAKPDILYTHNLADKHDTHVAVTVKVIQALRELPEEYLPKKVVGCEVWRSLDWLIEQDKLKFDVSGHPQLELSLLEVFDSQISGGKRYDLATVGRRLANATYSESHGVDQSNSIQFAMDLTPLILDKSLDINEFVQQYIIRFANDVAQRIKGVI